MPAKIEILPVAALWHPPETGQSIGSPETAETKLPIRFTSSKSVVDISAQIFPFESPLITPSSPSITSEQAFGDGRHVIIISEFIANSFGDDAHLAPISSNEVDKVSFKSKTVNLKPLLIKFLAILLPTFPKPIKPIFILLPSIIFY